MDTEAEQLIRDILLGAGSDWDTESLALSPDFAGKGDYVLIPESWHEPLRQRAVLLLRSGEVARRFYLFLQEPAARDAFRRYGFVLPGD